MSHGDIWEKIIPVRRNSKYKDLEMCSVTAMKSLSRCLCEYVYVYNNEKYWLLS